MAFPRLQELAAAQNSNNLSDAISIYIERKINDDLHFVAGLSHLWEVLYCRVNEHRLLIAELNVFGGPLALQCAECLTQLSQTEVLKMLEIRKSIAEIRMIPVRLYLLLYCVHGDDEVGTWGKIFMYSDTPPTDIGDDVRRAQNTCSSQTSVKKSAMDRSFSRGSTGEADNVKILQSCNGWLLSGGSRMPILIQISHLLHLEGKLFEWRGSLFLVYLDDFGSSEFTIYEMMIGCSVWTVRYRVHTDDFMTPLPEGWSIRSNVWSIVLGGREQDLFLVIKLSGKVVQYNLILKTFNEICDCGSNQLDDNHDDNDDDDDDDDDDDELLQQFQAEHNVYEFILSFASV
ncbi:hypothetical protein Tco_0883463 [Tanacetum coccineum]